jgi:hypothetical protein
MQYRVNLSLKGVWMPFIFPQDFDGCGGNDDDKYDQKKDCWRDPGHKIFSFPNLLSGPAASIEGVLNRMVGRFRSHQHGGDGGNVQFSWQRSRWGRI